MQTSSETPAPSDSESPEADSGTAPTESVGTAPASARAAGRSVSVRTLALGGVAAVGAIAIVAAIAVLGWRLNTVSSENSEQTQQLQNHQHAETIALDYATGAAQMSFEDTTQWRARLTQGTSPELTNRLTQASTSMEQLIIPLQWSSTAQPIAAKVLSSNDGIYEVVCFVNVLTRNSQSPDGIDSTATYKMTIDSNSDWMITEISGIDSALGDGSPPK
ncbi:hypothetical protein [Rhodococcus qingshengii]|uniref:hypothetical protein n=1 Tax=Rhodococcus qingshengii TaxID=334542 RepID=UPI0036DCC071